MKRKLFILGLVMCLSMCAAGESFSIIDVSVIPPEPDIFDSITVDVEGGCGQAGVTIDYTSFTVNENDLQLDVYATHGALTIPINWEHLEPIGTLEAANYDLTVKVFGTGGLMPYPPYVLNDTYEMSFTVIPEPATLLLLGLGGLGLIRKRKI